MKDVADRFHADAHRLRVLVLQLMVYTWYICGLCNYMTLHTMFCSWLPFDDPVYNEQLRINISFP